jgi:dCMP deaminase
MVELTKNDIICLSIAKEWAVVSPCLSRGIGAVVVDRDGIILGAGNNSWNDKYHGCSNETICPRKQKGFKSGEGLDTCPAIHAEVNAILDAGAGKGVIFSGTLYCWCGVPCKWCAGIIVNAGIKKVYCFDDRSVGSISYIDLGEKILQECGVEIITYSKEFVEEKILEGDMSEWN